MNWPETERLSKRIRRERPERTALAHASPGSKGHFFIRVSCTRKADRQAVPSSSAILYGGGQWTHYKAEHPDPFCRPEESYHADALGPETDEKMKARLRRRELATAYEKTRELETLKRLQEKYKDAKP